MTNGRDLPAATCKGCKHWHEGPIDPNNLGAPRAGECRERPPQLVTLMHPQRVGPPVLEFHAQYLPLPATFSACGQFSPRQAAVEV